MPLTEAFTRSVKPLESVKKYSDGGGLHLRVEPRGSKLWRMQYTFGNKQKSLTFGKYPIVSLAEARRKRDEAKKLIANGIDPAERVRIEKIAKKVASGNTFNAVADDLLAKAKRDGKAEATMTKKRGFRFALSSSGTLNCSGYTWTSAVPKLRAMLATSWLWVSRVRTLSCGSSGKTCVLSCMRRTGVEKRMRS